MRWNLLTSSEGLLSSSFSMPVPRNIRHTKAKNRAITFGLRGRTHRPSATEAWPGRRAASVCWHRRAASADLPQPLLHRLHWGEPAVHARVVALTHHRHRPATLPALGASRVPPADEDLDLALEDDAELLARLALSHDDVPVGIVCHGKHLTKRVHLGLRKVLEQRDGLHELAHQHLLLGRAHCRRRLERLMRELDLLAARRLLNYPSAADKSNLSEHIQASQAAAECCVLTRCS